MQYIPITNQVKINLIYLIDNNKILKAKKIFFSLHPADQAGLITSFSYDLKKKFISSINNFDDPHFLTYLDEETRNDIFEILGISASANVLNKLETDEVVEIIGDLEDDKDIKEILNQIPKKQRYKITKTLEYPESSIGRLMNQDFITVDKNFTVGEANKYLQNITDELPDDLVM